MTHGRVQSTLAHGASHLQRDVRKPDCPVGAVHPQLSGPRRLSGADPASTPTEKVGRSTSINRLGTGKRLDPAANDVKQHGEAGPQQDEVQVGFGAEASRCVEHAVDPAPDEGEVMQESRYGSYHRSASPPGYRLLQADPGDVTV